MPPFVSRPGPASLKGVFYGNQKQDLNTGNDPEVYQQVKGLTVACYTVAATLQEESQPPTRMTSGVKLKVAMPSQRTQAEKEHRLHGAISMQL